MPSPLRLCQQRNSGFMEAVKGLQTGDVRGKSEFTVTHRKRRVGIPGRIDRRILLDYGFTVNFYHIKFILSVNAFQLLTVIITKCQRKVKGKKKKVGPGLVKSRHLRYDKNKIEYIKYGG